MRAQKFQVGFKKGFRSILAVAVVSGGLILTASGGMAQSTSNVAVPPMTPAVTEVVKLAQAKVSDGTIAAYIKYSGQNYGLNADQILYLRQQGVSEAVILAMMNPASVPAVQPATTVPVPTTPPPAVASPGYGQVEPYFDSADNTYYYYDPYYYPDYYYGGYYWPGPFYFSYGWGGWGWHGRGWHDGDDWRRGGGWHGENGWHGGGVVHHGPAPGAGWHGGGGGWHGGGWHGGGGFGGGHGGGLGGGGRR